MTPYPVNDLMLAATLLCLGFRMPHKGVFEDSEELRRAVDKYKTRGIPVNMQAFSEHYKYLKRHN